MNKKYLLLIAVACLALIPVFYFLINSFTLFPKGPNTQHYDPETEEPAYEKVFEVSSLIEKLPHTGANFSMAYDYGSGLFYLYINPENTEAGDTELDTFLQQNNIDDVSQVIGLERSEVPVPTPAP